MEHVRTLGLQQFEQVPECPRVARHGYVAAYIRKRDSAYTGPVQFIDEPSGRAIRHGHVAAGVPHRFGEVQDVPLGPAQGGFGYKIEDLFGSFAAVTFFHQDRYIVYN